jgi:uncharacterized protein (TIGR02246 family)
MESALDHVTQVTAPYNPSTQTTGGPMRVLRTAAVLLLAVVQVSAFAQSKSDPALDKLRSAFLEAFNAKDAAKVAAFYTPDGVLMPPEMGMVKGRAAIEAHYAEGFKSGIGNLKLAPIESSTSGTGGFEAGTFDIQVTSGGTSMMLTGVGGSGAAVRARGKYVLVFKRTGNDWLIAYDIHNNDAPAAPPKK